MATNQFDSYARVEQIVCDILNDLGIPAEQDISGLGSAGWLAAFLDGKQYKVSIHISRTSAFTDDQVWAKLDENPCSRWMEVFVGTISDRMRECISREYTQHIVLDIHNLLYMARSNPELLDRLVAQIPFSVDGLEPVKPGFLNTSGTSQSWSGGYANSFSKGSEREWRRNENAGSTKTDTRDGRFTPKETECADALRKELAAWVGGKGSSSYAYEKLCTRTLMRLFADDLTLWNEQAKSNSDLYRFDLICKIKRDNRKDFWETAEKHFNSKYIIFEFKNYADKVTQKEVYTTLRYLYATALRRVAVIISPNGMDAHADKAIRGALRDEGKLILTLTNRDLVEMLDWQKKGRLPADYLSDKLDELLIDLEK